MEFAFLGKSLILPLHWAIRLTLYRIDLCGAQPRNKQNYSIWRVHKFIHKAALGLMTEGCFMLLLIFIRRILEQKISPKIALKCFENPSCNSEKNTGLHRNDRIFLGNAWKNGYKIISRRIKKEKTAEGYGTPVFQSLFPGWIFNGWRRPFVRFQMMAC
jgi:hypothetical protein